MAAVASETTGAKRQESDDDEDGDGGGGGGDGKAVRDAELCRALARNPRMPGVHEEEGEAEAEVLPGHAVPPPPRHGDSNPDL